jgi:uncharacterized membrane protein
MLNITTTITVRAFTVTVNITAGVVTVTASIFTVTMRITVEIVRITSGIVTVTMNNFIATMKITLKHALNALQCSLQVVKGKATVHLSAIIVQDSVDTVRAIRVLLE